MNAQILVCEPAGPGFDSNSTYTKGMDPMKSAQNVQCIHTSADKGTTKRQCHQNWMLGHCGRFQTAAGAPPMGSHGLCPHFYNSAFRNKFRAIAKPNNCPTSLRAVNQTYIDAGYHMGYEENRTKYV